jgi:dihydrodipicolinate synthase/N-acetylneuraminate lyase
MMNQLGMAAGPVRPPLPQVAPADKRDIQTLLETWKPMLS